MRFDIVMWTFNSGRTLEHSLSSIDRSIPEDRICHRIMVDGGSSDQTEKIARTHNWDFHVTRPGIPVQANLALSLVDTDLYASFEHDIVLAPKWLSRIEPLMKQSDVAVAQGLRLSKGSVCLDALDKWTYSHGRIERWFYSIDNNLYKTRIVRALGGYPQECPMTADGLLRLKILSRGLRWVTNTECISWHLRSSFPNYLHHVIKHIAMANFLWQPAPSPHLTMKLARILLTSPVAAAGIAGETHTPRVLVGYPLLRYVMMVTISVLGWSGKKKIVTIQEADSRSGVRSRDSPWHQSW